jgi:lipopolysaccharide/colanic/teichoic acid biosynthesis glycosyltransferase
MDILLALPAFIVVTIFVYPFVYLAIKLEDKGPVLYSHLRTGRHGKAFLVYKFRSMENLPTNEMKETKKVTRVGAFIRKTRIDELPQLWNVIKGDVSLIGPRPETPALVQEYSASVPFYNVRHIVRPGLSGWAQTQQHEVPKFGVDVKQTKIKLAYDMYYLKHSNLMTDLAIIVRTLKVLISKSGI